MKTIKVSSALHIGELVKRQGYDLRDQTLCFLVPDIPATVQAEQLFLETGEGLWGERLLTFAKLAGLVRINIKNPPGIISRASRLLIAEHIISEASSDFNYYNEIVNKREFADSVLGVIAELKHSNIPPRALHSSISKLRHSVFKSKMEDICKIYSEYDNKLKALHLGDDIDELRLIIERADNKLLQNCIANIKTLIVFGFTEFTETQMEVLKSIYENKIDVEIIEYDIQSSNNNDISLTAFDSIVDESKHCVDKINRLMESQNVNPSKIAVISKSNYGNSQIINVQFKSAGLEFSESTRARLITSHIGKLVLSIFKIKLSDFKKKSLFEFLRNPYVINYFGDSEKYNEYVSDLELLFLSHRMTGGFSSWSANTNIGKLRHSKKYSSVLVALIQKIRSAFNSNKVSVLINDLLNVLELTAFDRLNENELIRSRAEVNALNSMHGLLCEYRYFINEHFTDLKVDSLMEFYSKTTELLSQKRYSLTGPHSEDKIKKLDFLEARGTAFDHLFILGAGEGQILNTEYTDPVIKNNERTVMNRVFNREVFKTAAQIISSDQRLINLALNSSKNVYVSYVRYDSAGRAVTPSSILEDFGVIGTGDNVDITAFSDFGTDGLSIDDSNYYFIQNGIRSELKRYKRFSGLQQCEGLVNGNDFLKSLNTFSVTELEAYGICPYRYFASEILKLKYPSEPEDEPIPVDQGSVYHKILNLLFKELADIYGNKLDLREITDDELLKILNLIYESAEIEQEFGWLSDIKRTLNIKSITDKFLPAFVIQEALRIRRNNDKGFFPAEFEKKLSLKIDDATIEGKADRIDMSENAAIVIDYKLRGLSGRKFCDYKDLQLPLYLNCLAAKNIERHGAYYRSTERPDDEVGMDQDKKDFGHYLELSLQFVRSYIDNIRSGIFPPSPQKKDIEFFQQTFEVAKRKDNPCSYCEYSDLCRAYNTVYRTMED